MTIESLQTNNDAREQWQHNIRDQSFWFCSILNLTFATNPIAIYIQLRHIFDTWLDFSGEEA